MDMISPPSSKQVLGLRFVKVCSVLLFLLTTRFYTAQGFPSRFQQLLGEKGEDEPFRSQIRHLTRVKNSEAGGNQVVGPDMGLTRGESASRAAEHLMALAAANASGGPGKKKRRGNFKNPYEFNFDMIKQKPQYWSNGWLDYISNIEMPDIPLP